MAQLNALLVLFFITCLLCNEVYAFFGNNKKKEQEMKEAVANGVEMMSRGVDGNTMRELKEMMQDPEMMKEAQKMMKDPTFLKEVEKLKSDPAFLSMLQRQRSSEQRSQIDVSGEVSDGTESLSDVEIGLRELGKAARDPKIMQEALEMLKDPAIAAEVQNLMKDPTFKAQMKQYTNSPGFKDAMSSAAQQLEELSKDPLKMKKMEADFKNQMQMGMK